MSSEDTSRGAFSPNEEVGGLPPMTKEAWARYEAWVESTKIDGEQPSSEEMAEAQADAENEDD